MRLTVKLHAWTDYPIVELGDRPGEMAPVRPCTVVSWDRDKYCFVDVCGVRKEIKLAYIYSKPGRLREVKKIAKWKLRLLPRNVAR